MYNSEVFIFQEHAREVLSRFIPLKLLLRCFSLIQLLKYSLMDLVRYINHILLGFRSKTVIFLSFLLSVNSQKRLGYKESNTKYRTLS